MKGDLETNIKKVLELNLGTTNPLVPTLLEDLSVAVRYTLERNCPEGRCYAEI